MRDFGSIFKLFIAFLQLLSIFDGLEGFNFARARIVKGSLFSTKHVVYKLETRPFEFDVERRYSDFLWLRSILVNNYPECYIPPLPKKGVKRQFDKPYLKKRMIYLQFFIEAISNHHQLRSSPQFLDFLRINGLEDWNNSKSTYKQLKKRNPLNVTISGFLS